ncbi:DUF202 domain-containing protein [Pseudonocardia sp. TRM90224]|uniref:DUF202 domain-containing protein n=1 Tax=Pseudonocardia sp. TRM90224 TaxID=2812678 RepID=UPI001E4FFCE7|nr:DUF202 domain-containing protein [Pseudonocardia sp. TRM90224]
MTVTGRGALFDPGLQPERTWLAWRRTLLALAVGALVALRLLPPVLGTPAFWMSLVGLLLCGALWVLAGRRAATGRRALLAGPLPLPGGGLLFAVAALVTAAGALGLVWVVGSAH